MIEAGPVAGHGDQETFGEGRELYMGSVNF
jgi:hypothetical protein